MPHLQYTGPDGVTQRFQLRHRITQIGSSRDCHLVLQGPDIAASHCTLEHTAGSFKVESSSRSCVFYVGGKKLREHVLRHGDVMLIGNVEVTFSAIDPPAPAADPESAARLQIDAMRNLQRFSELLARSESSLDGLLSELIDQVVALTGASKGFLVLTEGDRYAIRVARGLDRQPVDDPEQLLSDKIIREVITSREPQIISDALHDGRFQNSMSVINLKLCSVMCAPMIVRGEFIGLIYVGNNSVVNLFKPSQLEMLRVYAAQAALSIKNAQTLGELRDASAGLQKRLDQVKFGQIIGACPQMIEVFKRVDKVAGTDINVLVTGETGTGKELIAQELHNRSPRAKGPLVTVNCGAIPENLIESELFGHIKGAFTGAVTNQVGKFQAADKGTIFLDEIGEMPMQLQVKLLRVLQDRQIQRVGDTRSVPVDVRVVAATNRDLAKEVQAGRFREDLFHRLNVIDIALPALRERGNDILLIARYFVTRYAREYGSKIDPASPFDAGAERAMLRFAWPGNIRQLENHIKKALVLADGPALTARDLDLEIDVPGQPAPVEISAPEQILPLAEARDLWQRDYINRVLALNSGNRTKTARDLGVDPRTIFRHLEREGEKGAASR
jgi:transcriptional regulator with GAF, ATPase, and Fis domain